MLGFGPVPPLTFVGGVFGVGVLGVGAIIAIPSIVRLVRHASDVRRVLPPRIPWTGHPQPAADEFERRVLADERCVWFEVAIVGTRTEGRRSVDYEVVKATRGGPFRIEIDGEGIEIDPAESSREPTTDRRALESLDASSRARLAELVEVPSRVQELDVVERWLPANTRLHVVTTRPAARQSGGAYRRGESKRMHSHVGVGSLGQYLALYGVTSALGLAILAWGANLIANFVRAY